MQEIKLDKHIKLLDCPGIVMSRDEDCASLALKNCIRVRNSFTFKKTLTLIFSF